MRVNAAIALLFACLSGCGVARYRFIHPEKTASDYERDHYECGLVAREATEDIEFADNPLVRGPAAGKEFADCMKYRYGWSKIACSDSAKGCDFHME